MSDYHEPYDLLAPEAREIHRALVSLREEIEAVDWYSQRIAVTQDAELRAVLTHNRDEEIEHACLTLEWLRRHAPGWDEQLRLLLFQDTFDVERGEHRDPGRERLRSGLGVANRERGGG